MVADFLRAGSRRFKAGGAATSLGRRATAWSIQHPVVAVVLLAIVARLLTALGVSLFADGFLVPDSHTYHRLAQQAAARQTIEWTGYERHLYDAVATYVWPLTAVYWVFWPTVLFGQMVSACFGAITAGAVAVLALDLLPRRAALLTGLAAALFPSQVLWSSLTLKDAAVWSVLALLGVAVHRGNRAGIRGVLGWACVAALLLVGLGHLRDYTTIVAAWAVLAAALVVPGAREVQRRLAWFVVAAAVPLLLGFGPLGASYIRSNAKGLPEHRAERASGAASAFVNPANRPTPLNPAVVGAYPNASGTTSTTSSTSVRPAGQTPAPIEAPADDELSANVGHLPRGLVAVLLEPAPWASKRNVSVTLASVESLLWYPMLVGAVLGLRSAWRRRDVLAFPALVSLGIVLVQAMSEGNIGTAYRHRGEFVWATILLAAFGFAELLERRAARSIAEAS